MRLYLQAGADKNCQTGSSWICSATGRQSFSELVASVSSLFCLHKSKQNLLSLCYTSGSDTASAHRRWEEHERSAVLNVSVHMNCSFRLSCSCSLISSAYVKSTARQESHTITIKCIVSLYLVCRPDFHNEGVVCIRALRTGPGVICWRAFTGDWKLMLSDQCKALCLCL